MLLHGVTGPPDQSSRNSGNKFQLARSLMWPNFAALQQKCARYPPASKQYWVNIGRICRTILATYCLQYLPNIG